MADVTDQKYRCWNAFLCAGPDGYDLLTKEGEIVDATDFRYKTQPQFFAPESARPDEVPHVLARSSEMLEAEGKALVASARPRAAGAPRRTASPSVRNSSRHAPMS
jgi:hypothetical protein